MLRCSVVHLWCSVVFFSVGEEIPEESDEAGSVPSDSSPV